ncbi:MAG: hypothetical protein CV089_04085 [Nitrospira sp. WS110]|nr:hypothetical protein [Nitrospira sp. WS110]
MKLYQAFATDLTQLLGHARAVRITVPSYMSLSIEDIGMSPDGHRLVSLCQYGEQNGDLMRDPDIVFLFHTVPGDEAAEPVSFRNDYLGISQEVYRYDETGRRTHVVPSLKQELKEFARAWFATLRDQGFFAPTTVREILSPSSCRSIHGA